MRIHVETTIDKDNRRALKKFFKAFYGEEFAPKNEFHYNEAEDGGGIASIDLYFKGKPPVKIIASIAGLGKITYHMFDNQGTYSLESDVQTEIENHISEVEKNDAQSKTDDALAFLDEKVEEEIIELDEKAEEKKKEVTTEDQSTTNRQAVREIIQLMKSSTNFETLAGQIADFLKISERMNEAFVFILKTVHQENKQITWHDLIQGMQAQGVTFNTYFRQKLIHVVKEKTGMNLVQFSKWISSTFEECQKVGSKDVQTSKSADNTIQSEIQVEATAQEVAEETTEQTEDVVQFYRMKEFLDRAAKNGQDINFKSYETFVRNLSEIDKSLPFNERVNRSLYLLEFPERFMCEEKAVLIDKLTKYMVPIMENRKILSGIDEKDIAEIPVVIRLTLAECINKTLKSFGCWGLLEGGLSVCDYIQGLRIILMTVEELKKLE